MDKRQRMVLLGIAAVIAAVAVVIALTSGGDDNKGSTTSSQAAETGQTQADTSTTTATADAPQETVEKIEVKDGQPVGGLRKIKVKKGERVEIDVTSNTADEAHLHGFDIEKELQPNRTAKFRFTANIEGVFELELHHAGSQLARITVAP